MLWQTITLGPGATGAGGNGTPDGGGQKAGGVMKGINPGVLGASGWPGVGTGVVDAPRGKSEGGALSPEATAVVLLDGNLRELQPEKRGLLTSTSNAIVRGFELRFRVRMAIVSKGDEKLSLQTYRVLLGFDSASTFVSTD